MRHPIRPEGFVVAVKPLRAVAGRSAFGLALPPSPKRTSLVEQLQQRDQDGQGHETQT